MKLISREAFKRRQRVSVWYSIPVPFPLLHLQISWSTCCIDFFLSHRHWICLSIYVTATFSLIFKHTEQRRSPIDSKSYRIHMCVCVCVDDRNNGYQSFSHSSFLFAFVRPKQKCWKREGGERKSASEEGTERESEKRNTFFTLSLYMRLLQSVYAWWLPFGLAAVATHFTWPRFFSATTKWRTRTTLSLSLFSRKFFSMLHICSFSCADLTCFLSLSADQNRPISFAYLNNAELLSVRLNHCFSLADTRNASKAGAHWLDCRDRDGWRRYHGTDYVSTRTATRRSSSADAFFSRSVPSVLLYLHWLLSVFVPLFTLHIGKRIANFIVQQVGVVRTKTFFKNAASISRIDWENWRCIMIRGEEEGET